MVGEITKLASELKHLSNEDPFRSKMTDQLLDKLYVLDFKNEKLT